MIKKTEGVEKGDKAEPKKIDIDPKAVSFSICCECFLICVFRTRRIKQKASRRKTESSLRR